MIESSTSMTYIMASRLHSVNRWCVTGTPISRSFDSLCSLLSFLQAKPFSNKYWWKELLRNQYVAGNPERLHDLLKLIMWRNSKAAVNDQIDIPIQDKVEYWLSFSAIEKHLYDKQEQEFVEDVCKARVPKKAVEKLLRLRQA